MKNKMKHRRPHRHFRVIRTRQGRRPILINPRIIKRRKTFARKGRISKKERKIFNYLSNPAHKKEYGGAMDFDNKGKLEQFVVTPGKASGVEFEDDFEVLYHTHPDKYETPPSMMDLFTLIKSKNQQAEIVFRDGTVFTVIKTKKSKELNKLPKKELMKVLYKTLKMSKPNVNKNFEKRSKEIFEKELGFHVQLINKSDRPVSLNIKPVEKGDE